MTDLKKTIYQEKGFEDREAYLNSLAEEYDIDSSEVIELAELLGPSEDFDGLVTSLQDYQGGF